MSPWAANTLATISHALMNLWFARTSTLSCIMKAKATSPLNAMKTRHWRQLAAASATAASSSFGPKTKARYDAHVCDRRVVDDVAPEERGVGLLAGHRAGPDPEQLRKGQRSGRRR